VGRPIRRRELLLGAGASALAFAADPLLARAGVVDRVGEIVRGGLAPELVTVTDRGFEAWWVTAQPADTTVRIARAGGGGFRELRLEGAQSVHVAALDDLEPGTRYRYELLSGGRRVPRSPVNPGWFRTLDPPPGDLLATIAVLNDMHVGERCSGTIQTVGDQSVPPCFTGDDYAYRMTRSALEAIERDHDVDFVIANGDLTDRGRPDEVRRALDLLGRLTVPWKATRGNHDRRLPDAESCGPDGDCLRAQAFPERQPGDHALHWMERVGDGVGIVGLDSCDPDSGRGRLDLGGQLAFLDRSLAELRREGRTALLAFHHHLTLQANTSHPPPIVFGVDPNQGGLDCLDVLAHHDNVRLVLHGHTHRNYVSYDPACGPRLPFLENGATKEYPGGYAIVRVHEDGVVRTFHRMSDLFARDWVRTTAGQIWGRHADYTRGTLVSRAFVHRDDRPLRPPRPSVFGPL
jgi:predicted phosphodiesterase